MRGLLVLALAGCSFTIRSKPTELMGGELECRGNTIPIIDTVMSGLSLGAATTVAIAGTGKDGPGLGVTTMLSISLALPGVAYGVAAIGGYRKVRRCRAEVRARRAVRADHRDRSR